MEAELGPNRAQLKILPPNTDHGTGSVHRYTWCLLSCWNLRVLDGYRIIFLAYKYKTVEDSATICTKKYGFLSLSCQLDTTTNAVYLQIGYHSSLFLQKPHKIKASCF